MCRILILKNIDSDNTKLFLDRFRLLSNIGNVPKGLKKGHRDGWGLGGFKSGKLIFFTKESGSAATSKEYAKSIISLISNKNDIIMGHLRKASIGKRSIENTQPFFFKGFLFLQNGTIFESEKLELNKKFAKLVRGETDSERFFIFLLQLIGTKKKVTATLVRKNIFKAVAFVKKYLNYTALNFVMTNGKFIWALREINDNNDSVKAKRLENYYTLYLGKLRKKFISISSEKLEIRKVLWETIGNHELLEIDIKNKIKKLRINNVINIGRMDRENLARLV